MKIHPVGAKLFHADRQMDRHDEEPKNHQEQIYYTQHTLIRW